MFPSFPISQVVTFDGANESIAFSDFCQSFEQFLPSQSSGALSVSEFNDIEYILPMLLYGKALRFYESLDADCQGDGTVLYKAMAKKFPRYDEPEPRAFSNRADHRVLTKAVAPPVTSSSLAVPIPVVDKGEESAINDNTHGVDSIYRASFASLSRLVRKSRVRSGTPPSLITKGSRIEVHSLFIEYAHGGTKLRPISTSIQVEVDLKDPVAVVRAMNGPLLTIPSNDDAERYKVGFRYSVLQDNHRIDFCHQVLAPRKSRIDYLQQTGVQGVSPIGQHSQAFSITDFIYNHGSPYIHRKKPPPGTYSIRSHLNARNPNASVIDPPEELGYITWTLHVD